jgi:prevent-host-death family protein
MLRTIVASEFKAKCLALIDQVADSGNPIVITKNGKPLVELVPHRVPNWSPRGIWKGKGNHQRRHHLANRCRVGCAQVILLDTHAAVWLSDDPALGQRSCSIALAARSENQLAICAISFWEIALLIAKHRLEMHCRPAELRAELLDTGVIELALTETSHYWRSN